MYSRAPVFSKVYPLKTWRQKELPGTELYTYMLGTGKISEPLETTSTIHFKSCSKQSNKAMFRNTTLWRKRLWRASTVPCQLQGLIYFYGLLMLQNVNNNPDPHRLVAANGNAQQQHKKGTFSNPFIYFR